MVLPGSMDPGITGLCVCTHSSAILCGYTTRIPAVQQVRSTMQLPHYGYPVMMHTVIHPVELCSKEVISLHTPDPWI